MTNQELNQAIASKIDGFAALPDGWHFGDGIGAVAGAVKLAHAINSLLADYGARNIEVFPCVDGGVLVSGYGSRDTLEVRCHPDGRMDLSHEVDDEQRYWRDAVSISDIEAYLGGLEWLPQNLFVPCIPFISARRGDDLTVRLSSHLPETGEYQFSKLPARWMLADASVDTSRASTVMSCPVHLSSGELVQAFSPRIVGSPTSYHRLAMPVTETFVISEEADASP